MRLRDNCEVYTKLDGQWYWRMWPQRRLVAVTRDPQPGAVPVSDEEHGPYASQNDATEAAETAWEQWQAEQREEDMR